MEIGKISSNSYSVANLSRPAFSGKAKSAPETCEEDYFDKNRAQGLPEGKAIKISRRPTIGLLNVLLLPFGFVGFSVKPKLSLVDIDKNNLSDKEKKQIEKGKLIDFVPVGYEIKGNKVVKK